MILSPEEISFNPGIISNTKLDSIEIVIILVNATKDLETIPLTEDEMLAVLPMNHP